MSTDVVVGSLPDALSAGNTPRPKAKKKAKKTARPKSRVYGRMRGGECRYYVTSATSSAVGKR